MKTKAILILLVLLFLLGAGVYYLGSRSGSEETDRRPQMWAVEEDKIIRIRIELPPSRKAVTFHKDREGKWRFFDPPAQEVDKKRWGGILTLVSGPKARRLIAEPAQDLKQYGLDRPSMVITLFLLEEKEPLVIEMGHPTPPGDHYYMKLRNQPALYVMDALYCRVLMRLAEDPPYPPAISPGESGKEG